MRIVFWGHEFDLFDEVMRRKAANLAAVEKMHAIATSDVGKEHGDKVALVAAFEELLTDLLDYWLCSGATLQSASAVGCEGIAMKQALEQHNHLGDLIGQAPLEILAATKPQPNAQLEGQDDT
jgi:hypothetical protein